MHELKSMRIYFLPAMKSRLRQTQPSLLVHHHLLHIKLATNELNHLLRIVLRK